MILPKKNNNKNFNYRLTGINGKIPPKKQNHGNIFFLTL